MKRSVAIPLLLGGAALVALSLLCFVRIPPNVQAVRMVGGTAVSAYGPGVHFVPPFSRSLVRYPLGPVELHLPRQGRFEALTKQGRPAAMSLGLRLEFAPGAAEGLHRVFGNDAIVHIENRLRETIEIEAAKVDVGPGGDAPTSFVDAVIADISRNFADGGVRVNGFRLQGWDVRGEPVQVPVSEKPLRRVIFIGVDGADWRVIRPLMDAGRLPNFAKLVNQGATGPLKSIEPLLSPLIWTTMATGKLPEDHGILNFTIVDPKTGRKVPVTRLSRKVDAFWNMLSDYDRKVDVIGWLATFPAEKINGVMVTDRLGYLAYAEGGSKRESLPGAVSPAERADEITRLVTKSSAVDYQPFQRFVHIPSATFLKNRELEFDPQNPVNNMILLYASTVTFARIAEHLLTEDRPDFLGVYFELVDATKHLFMMYSPPRRGDVTDADYAMYKDAVNEAYVLQDEIIGRLMALGDEETVFIVASDHGFKSGDRRPKQRPEIWAGQAAFWHLPDGVVCLYGNGIRHGFDIVDASILDITPTILALQGLPQPNDMPGRVLTSAFEDDLAASINHAPIATLQRTRAGDDKDAALADEATEDVLRKLETLGYVGTDNPDAHNNLGQRYQDQGRYADAIEEFKQALALNPNFPGALNNLGVCYGRLRQYEEAEQSFRKALAINPKDAYAMNNLAIMFLEQRQLDKALQFGEHCIAVEPNYANGHLTLGSIYATMGRVQPAEAEFNKVLEIDPTNEKARKNLERLRSTSSKS